VSDIEKESYEDFLNFEKLWEEWRLREEIPLETFVASGYFCVEEFYNFSKEYFDNRFKQQLAERDALILELEKVRGFYSDDSNYQSVQVGYGDKSQLKYYDMIDISRDDLVRNIGGKLARTPLKNQKLLNEIKGRVE
jgi:hypothetical protein